MIISALHSGTVLPQEGSLTVLRLQLRNRWSDHQLRSLLQFNIPLFYSLISNIHNNNAAGFEVFNIFFLSAAEGYSIRRPQPISAAERECFLYKSCEESEVFQEKLILSYNPPCLFFQFYHFSIEHNFVLKALCNFHYIRRLQLLFSLHFWEISVRTDILSLQAVQLVIRKRKI